jgi:hypothetical protein
MFFPVAPGPQKVSLFFDFENEWLSFLWKRGLPEISLTRKKETRWGKIRGKTEFSFPDRRTLSSKRENI